MINGMTGFGRAGGQHDWGGWSWDVRSVNGKSVDGRVSCPAGCEAIEFEARKRLKERFNRGNFQLQLRIDGRKDEQAISVNERELARLARQMRKWRGPNASPLQVEQLLAVPGVIDGARRSSAISEEAAADILTGLGAAFDALAEARAREGQALSGLLLGMLAEMEKLAQDAGRIAEDQPAKIRERFEARVRELASDTATDPDRIAQEVILMANKADVREELDRLQVHITNGRNILQNESPAGRKLDFLSQELNRETNTLCSKSASLELTNVGLALKSLIDQFREQVQNVE